MLSSMLHVVTPFLLAPRIRIDCTWSQQYKPSTRLVPQRDAIKDRPQKVFKGLLQMVVPHTMQGKPILISHKDFVCL